MTECNHDDTERDWYHDSSAVLVRCKSCGYVTWEKNANAITPRDAFDGGFRLALDWWRFGSEPDRAIELAWEHFQAERMKAAASTERYGYWNPPEDEK